MECYNIAGLCVRAACRDEPTRSRLSAYRCAEFEKADIEINIPDSVILRENEKTPQFSYGECEYMLTAVAFYNELIEHGGLLLHSAAISLDGGAYLFSAESGVGKSTHIQLWQQVFGKERTFVINDDKPAILSRGGDFFACGTPWSGKCDISRNVSVPLRGIAFLERGEKNEIWRISPSEALVPFLEQTLRPSEPDKIGKMLTLVDNLLSKVPIFRARVNMSPEAAQICCNAMSENMGV